jgi:hypothetical protein
MNKNIESVTTDITGKKVKLDVEKMRERKLSKRFNEFLDANENTVFTAVLDSKSRYTMMYILDEDQNDPPWLFYREDLILMEE